MTKPSKIIKEYKQEYMDKDSMTKNDAEFKAILRYLNEQYFKKPSNEVEDYNV